MNARAAMILFSFTVVGCSLCACLADTLTGELRGSVLDVEGRVPLSGVTVTLLSMDRGWTKQLPTDTAGDFVFIQLDPGNYSVRAEKPGYYPNERTDILIRLNTPKVVLPPFELRKLVATPTRQITLRGEQNKIAVVDLSTSGPTPQILAMLNEPGRTSMLSLLDGALRWNFDSRLIQALPLSGARSFDQLALLSPGVSRVPFSTGHGPAVGFGVGTAGQFTVNGLRGRSNNFTVDGADNNDEDIGVRRQGFVVLVPQTVESVQEFQVVTAGFPAEFGRNAGSMVNAVSRSGQKQLHGSVYGLFSDGRLGARDFFEHNFADTVNAGSLNGGSYKEKDSRQGQYGGALSGPVRIPQLFYFLTWEVQRYLGNRMEHFVVPTAGERGLRTRDGFVPMSQLSDFFQKRRIDYSDVAGRGVFSLYPLPNNAQGPFGANNYSQTRRNDQSGAVLAGKIDWRIAPDHSAFGRYNFTNDDALVPFTGEAISSALGAHTRTQNLSLFLNSTVGALGNALRFSYGRTHLAFPPGKGSPLLFGSAPVSQVPAAFSQTIETSYGRFGPFGATGPIGQLWILPFSPIGIDVFNFPQGRVDNTFQASDFVARTWGRHALKLGFDVRRSQLNGFSDRNSRPLLIFGGGIVYSSYQGSPFATSDGLLRGTDLAALGAAAGFLQTISTGPVPDTTIGLRLAQYDLFMQDTWKAKANLTLNLGVRYELQAVPSEVNGRIERTFGATASQYGHLPPEGSQQNQDSINAWNQAFDAALEAWHGFLAGRQSIYQAERNNLAPRLAMSWDPSGHGHLALRASYTLAYDANLGAVTSQSRNVFPTFAPVNLDPNFQLPKGLLVNHLSFFDFTPTNTPLVRPGTLNTYNLTGDAFATGLGALFMQAPPFPGGSLSSNGLAFTLPAKNLKTARTQQLVLSLEKQLGDDQLVTVSYVGTRGSHFTRFTAPNAGLLSTPVLFPPDVNRSSLSIYSLPPTMPPTGKQRPQSALGAYAVFENSAGSNYHSLQLTVERQLRRGLQYRAAWTWSHTIDEVSDPFDGRGFYALPQNSARTDLERASANFDVRHRLIGWLVWHLSKSAAHSAWGGWRLAAIAEFQTGQPFTVNTSLDRNRDGNLTDRLDSVAGIDVCSADAQAIRIDGAVSRLSLVAPQGQDGRVGRNSFRAAGIATVDLAIWKQFVLAGETSINVRLEIFNILNRTNFGIPVRILESPGFGRVYDTQLGPRSIRLAIKLAF